jgi:hypothetical protein
MLARHLAAATAERANRFLPVFVGPVTPGCHCPGARAPLLPLFELADDRQAELGGAGAVDDAVIEGQ